MSCALNDKCGLMGDNNTWDYNKKPISFGNSVIFKGCRPMFPLEL